MTEFNHHGIQGQKWGVQNGPPYPLDDSASKQKIKKSIYNQSKVMNSLTDEDLASYFGLPKSMPSSIITNKKKRKDEFFTAILQNPDRYEKAHKIISENKNVTMADLDDIRREWNISWVTSPEARGTGVTQTNIEKAIKLVREYSDLPIVAKIDLKNIPSQKTALKAGFKYAGIDNKIDGRYGIDTLIYKYM